MTATTSTTAPRSTAAARARRIRPPDRYWDFRTLSWEPAPRTVPAPRAGS
jgi:hypothetical protein